MTEDYSAERYESLLESGVRESALLRAPKRWPEIELQAHWYAGDFGREFRTVAGEIIRIIQFGVWNREAGPDFTEAAITINDGEPIRGAIEFDIDARDWERHGHATNPAYEHVILHVYIHSGTATAFARTPSNRLIPQVLLDTARLAELESPEHSPAAQLGRCAGPLREMSREKALGVLLAAARYRLRKKSAYLARLREIHGSNEALYQASAAALGYKSNKLPFTLLAQRMPLRILSKRREEIDALLFGISGFLPARDLTPFDEQTRGYIRELWETWWSCRSEFERIIISPGLWRLGGQRPLNHPQRRLAALCQLVRNWRGVRELAERPTFKNVCHFFEKITDAYWDHNYTLSSRSSAKPMALVGESRAVEILINVLLPFAGFDENEVWQEYLKVPAVLSNRVVETASARLFGSESNLAREVLKTAAAQQGLIQVYENFCLHDASDCVRCRFPQQLAKW